MMGLPVIQIETFTQYSSMFENLKNSEVQVLLVQEGVQKISLLETVGCKIFAYQQMFTPFMPSVLCLLLYDTA